MIDFFESSYAYKGLNAKEMADLPSVGWRNFLGDPTKYMVSFYEAWRVTEDIFNFCDNFGLLCLEHEGKYYVAK